MNKSPKEILKLIAKYAIENPNQRFTQIIFNLNINKFDENDDKIRDIYNDPDEEILI